MGLHGLAPTPHGECLVPPNIQRPGSGKNGLERRKNGGLCNHSTGVGFPIAMDTPSKKSRMIYVIARLRPLPENDTVGDHRPISAFIPALFMYRRPIVHPYIILGWAAFFVLNAAFTTAICKNFRDPTSSIVTVISLERERQGSATVESHSTPAHLPGSREHDHSRHFQC